MSECENCKKLEVLVKAYKEALERQTYEATQARAELHLVRAEEMPQRCGKDTLSRSRH